MYKLIEFNTLLYLITKLKISINKLLILHIIYPQLDLTG